MKRQSAAADAFRLIPDRSAGHPADGDAYSAEPFAKRSAQFNLAPAGPESLCLQVKKNQTGVAAEGDAHKFGGWSIPYWPTPWLNHERYALCSDPPGCVIS